MKEFIFNKSLYTGPMKFELPEPVKVPITKMREFLADIAPSEFLVFRIEHFEYGDFDNFVDAVIRDVNVSLRFSDFAGGTVDLRTEFWYYNRKQFWKECTQEGFMSSSIPLDKISIVTKTVSEVFIISKKDFYWG